jgi:uncharacterized protein
MPIWSLALTACSEDDAARLAEKERAADFSVSAGVESVTVLDAEPSTPMTLYNADDTPLVTLISDHLGQAHFAYIPAEHMVLDPSNFEGVSLADGNVLKAASGYYIQDDSSERPNWSGTFSVLSVYDVADESFYGQQVLDGIHHSPLTGDEGDYEDGYQYIEMRDGALLSAMVRLPDEGFFGEGPYPTVITYSGYSPSRPDQLPTGALIANALGYATVSVNMRGSGCSGGVFDVFNRAQHADGYDLAEIVARQDWVLNGQVGMVGLSYPGISQLYVASTNPPSLAAIVPLSTIADAWEMQWPGGIYNKGFTQQWVAAREAQSHSGGSSWVDARIEAGDVQCEDNLILSAHSVDFETFLRGLEMRPADADDRDLNLLVEDIELPVFYGGSFQDEQTGAQFGDMLDRFHSTAALKVQITNGRHPDGYAPNAVSRWFEFLEFYVAERIPVLNPFIRAFGADEFGGTFGMEETDFEEDRFAEYESYDEALEAYESEKPIRVLFEAGAGSDQVGAPVARSEAAYDTWPSEEAAPLQWFLGAEGSLLDEAEEEGADSWRFDSDADDVNFFGPSGYQLLVPLWDNDWTHFEEGYIASYVTDPFPDDAVLAGPGYATLWVRSPVDDVMVQVGLSEVRPDGMETLIQTGWLRLSHRAVVEGEDLRLVRSFSEADFDPVPIDEWVEAKVAIPSFAHPIREGSSLRISVSSPGRDHGTWQFETPAYDETPVFELGYGGSHPSSLTLAVLPGVEVVGEHPPCPGLRGQPCREYLPMANDSVE